MQSYALATSPGGRFLAARLGRTLALFGHDRRRDFELDSEEVDLTFAAPDVLVEITRVGARTRVALREVPSFELLAGLELEGSLTLRATTGSRLALVAADMQHVAIVRVAQRAIGQQALDVGVPFEFVVGLERDQLLFSLPKELKVWDAVSGRPLLKLALQLPPAPRVVGNAAGHLWAIRKKGEDVFVYRLSDGRPFQHRIGAKIEEVISHPASPVLALATERGLVRLHCLAHTVAAIERAPWTPAAAGGEHVPLAQLVNGDDIRLLGLPSGARVPWMMQIGGTGGARASAPETFGDAPPAPAPAPVTRVSAALVHPDAALDAQDAAMSLEPVAAVPPSQAPAALTAAWREAFGFYGEQLAVGGSNAELPRVPDASELDLLGRRLDLDAAARRALAVLYSLHLAGAGGIAISRLARALEDWREALGQGELSALAMIRRRDGLVSLRAAVCDLLDGAPPRAVRLAGDGAQKPRVGVFRMSREGRSDAEIEAELVGKLGRIAIVHGELRRGLLEARLHGATAVSLAVPGERPSPWPRDAGLVLVLYGNASSWVADVPAL